MVWPAVIFLRFALAPAQFAEVLAAALRPALPVARSSTAHSDLAM